MPAEGITYSTAPLKCMANEISIEVSESTARAHCTAASDSTSCKICYKVVFTTCATDKCCRASKASKTTDDPIVPVGLQLV